MTRGVQLLLHLRAVRPQRVDVDLAVVCFLSRESVLVFAGFELLSQLGVRGQQLFELRFEEPLLLFLVRMRLLALAGQLLEVVLASLQSGETKLLFLLQLAAVFELLPELLLLFVVLHECLHFCSERFDVDFERLVVVFQLVELPCEGGSA